MERKYNLNLDGGYFIYWLLLKYLLLKNSFVVLIVRGLILKNICREGCMRNMQYGIITGENPIIFLKTEDLPREGCMQDLASTYSILGSTSAKEMP